MEPQKTKILDFGGAKLRNTLYLLEKGYTVYSCEFEDLFQRSKQANELLNKCKEYPNFKKLVFPNEFIEFDDEFDVVLLINILNIMPVPIERYCVLALCREKMKDGGRLLWYTQHGTYSEENAVTKLYDGLVTGKGRKYHMFYRDFSRKEIHDLLTANGFSYNKKFKFSMSGTNQAYVFIADGDILVDKTLKLTEQLRKRDESDLETIERSTRWKIQGDDVNSKKVVYDTKVPTKTTIIKEINILREYLKEMTTLKPGKEDATVYHDLIFNMLISIFDNKLRKPQKEEYIADGTQRVDITFKNLRDEGFFKQLDEGYHIVCPNIFIECKNYNEDLGNPEFAQIQNRLNRVRGQFGIIVCRKIINYRRVKKRQDNLVKDEKYIIVLVDSDIKKLIKMKLNGKNEEIDDYLEDKFKKLV